MTTDRDREQREARQGEWELQRRSSEVGPDEGYQSYPGVNLLEEQDRQRQHLGRELRAMDRRIEESEGYRLSSRMSLLEKSYFIYDTNYLNLRHVLEEFEQPMVFLKLWEERTRDRLDLFLDDVIRLFHNYLAGATTLLDHIDTLRDGLDGEMDFSEEYQARWEEKLSKPALARFMEDLLVYMLHQGLPFALAELNFGRIGSGVEVNSAIRLDVDKLKEWEHWSEKGREYLATLEGKVKLDDVAREHAAIVASFYQWFVLRQSELHRETLRELEELEERRRGQLQKMRCHEDFLEAAQKTTSNVRQEREKLSNELDEERERREHERARVEKLEAELERERNKGFWRRLFSR